MARKPHYHGERPCPYNLKKDCDEAIRAWKADNKATAADLEAARKAQLDQEREERFLAFQEKERLRVLEILKR